MSQYFRFKKELYSREALLKASYRYIDEYYLYLDADDAYYYVEITPRDGINETNDKEYMNEILLQETRRLVAEQTGTLREIMYARTMASTIIEEPGISDENSGDNADSILTDWFDEYEE